MDKYSTCYDNGLGSTDCWTVFSLGNFVGAPTGGSVVTLYTTTTFTEYNSAGTVTFTASQREQDQFVLEANQQLYRLLSKGSFTDVSAGSICSYSFDLLYANGAVRVADFSSGCTS